MEKIAWLLLGGTALVAALRASRSLRALHVARAALGVLYIIFGALVHVVYLATGQDYSTFATAAHLGFVRDTWQSLVVPNHLLFISLLIVFEATVGILILAGGRATQLGLCAALAMHVALLLFGWIITIWSIVMLATLAVLLHAERHQPTTSPPARHVPAWVDRGLRTS